MATRPIIRIVVTFVCLYSAALAVACILFNVRWPGAVGLLSLLTFYVTICAGLLLGSSLELKKTSTKDQIRREPHADRLFDVLLVVSCVSVVYAWTLLLDYYGGVLVMLASAFEIREATIGSQDSVVPTLVSYATSPVYAVWVYELARGEQMGSMRKLRLALAFVAILLIDLMTFGRVGTLFALVSTVAWFFSKKRRIRVRAILLIVCILAVSTIPRLVRGDFDNFEGSLDRYRPAMRVQTPEVFNFAVALLPYYAGGFFSAGQLIERAENDGVPDGGIHTFTPVVNAYNRLVGVPRIVSIDDYVDVAFEHNVHGLPWDIIRDFGEFGFFPAAFVFGFFLGFISTDSRSRLGLASIYFVGAVILFFPVYSLLSFGGFFISLGFLIVLRVLKLERQ